MLNRELSLAKSVLVNGKWIDVQLGSYRMSFEDANLVVFRDLDDLVLTIVKRNIRGVRHWPDEAEASITFLCELINIDFKWFQVTVAECIPGMAPGKPKLLQREPLNRENIKGAAFLLKKALDGGKTGAGFQTSWEAGMRVACFKAWWPDDSDDGEFGYREELWELRAGRDLSQVPDTVEA